MRLLVIEDDREMRMLLKTTLEAENFVVDIAEDGRSGSFAARTNDYDLIVLDNILPYKTGLEVCREIRDNGQQMPILILSIQSEIEDKVSLLKSGADDYLIKPHSHNELVARIKAMLRRPATIQKTVLSVRHVTLHTESQKVYCNKKEVYLTRKEYSLLELLFKNIGKIVTKGMIMEHVWDMEYNPFSKTIETHILNIRKKIEIGRSPLIHNIPGRGYRVE